LKVDLTLLELEILIYAIDSRGADVLGPHARSARKKLVSARGDEHERIKAEIGEPELELPEREKKRNGEFNDWSRMRESSNLILPLFESRES
jgi:hypothetical protein